jgi:hypothetical protein
MVFQGQDAWRKHPLLHENWRRPFPGLGIAVGIFCIYLFGEALANIAFGKICFYHSFYDTIYLSYFSSIHQLTYLSLNPAPPKDARKKKLKSHDEHHH